MSAQDKVSVLRVAIVTDTDTPVYEYDFIPPTGRSVPPVRRSRRTLQRIAENIFF